MIYSRAMYNVCQKERTEMTDTAETAISKAELHFRELVSWLELNFQLLFNLIFEL